jgi:hypothetical protein
MVKTHLTRKNGIKVYIKDRITETTCVEDEYSVLLLPPETWQLTPGSSASTAASAL